MTNLWANCIFQEAEKPATVLQEKDTWARWAFMALLSSKGKLRAALQKGGGSDQGGMRVTDSITAQST